MLNNINLYKYETPFNIPFLITQCFTNGTEKLQYGHIQSSHNICRIKTCKSDINNEDINPKNMSDDVKI